MKVTQSDLLDAIAAALSDPGGGEGESVQDLAAKTGYSDSRIRSRLQVLSREGRLLCSKVRRQVAIDGRMSVIPVYRLKAK